MPKPHTVLTLDTALNGCSAGLFTNSSAQGHYEDVAMARGQAEALWPMIARVRAAANIDYADIDGVAVTCGPGNFTGLRIALAVARTFARMQKISAYAVSTTHAIAEGYARQCEGVPDHNICVALDTKRGDYYTQIFSCDCMAIEPPVIRDARAIYTLLEERGSMKLIGHGLSALVADAPGVLAGRYDDASLDRRPDPAVMAAMCFEGLISPGGADELCPLYMREAETNMGKQSK